MRRELIDRLDDAIQRGVTEDEDFAYISMGGNLVFVPANGAARVFRLEEV